MPTPMQVQPFISFLGTEEGINQVLVPEVYSPADSVNVWCDLFGRIRRIKGAVYLNSTAIVTNAGATNTGIPALFNYIADGGSYASQHLLALAVSVTSNVEEWWKSTDNGATWTFLATADLSAATVPDFAQYRSILLITRPGQAVVKYNGTAVSNAGLTQSPQVTSAADPGGTNLNGTYQWKLVSMVGDVRQQGSLPSTALQLENEQGDLSWTADSNMSVTGYELYRTTGTGGVFYFVNAIAGRTTVAFMDNVADRVILANRALAEYGDAPPTGVKFVEMHKERAWYGSTSAFPNRAWYSDPGRPESVGINNNVDFNDVEGTSAILTGFTGGFEGKLVAWTEDAIFTVSGTGSVIEGIPDLYVRKSAASLGTVSHRSVVSVPQGAIFRDAMGRAQQTGKPMLAYMTRLGDFRLFNGETDEIISSAIRNLSVDPTWRDYNHGVHDEARGMIVWWYTPMGGGNPQTHAVAWNYRVGAWHHITAWPGWCSVVIRTATAQQRILVGSNNGTTGPAGRISEIFSGDVLGDGSQFVGRWASGTLYGRLGEDTAGVEQSLPAFHLYKRYRWAEILLQTNADVEVQLQAFGSNQLESGTPWVTKDLSPFDTTRTTTQQKVTLKNSTGRFLHDHGLRFVIEDKTAVVTPKPSDWALEGISIGYNVLPGTKRDRG